MAVLHIGDDLVCMTWLGRLLNRILAEGLRRHGSEVVDGPFHLALTRITENELLELLRQTVKNVASKNPLACHHAERMVDLGPHFVQLSPTLREQGS